MFKGQMSRPSRLITLVAQTGLLATLHLSLATTAIVVMTESTAFAQKGGLSTQKLIDQAREKFEDQQYDESIQKLSAALLRSDITVEQKTEVYRWLAYNYIVLKQEDSAKTAAYALYALDEDYALPAKESPKFREPFAKFKTQWIDEGRPGKKTTEKAVAAVTIKHLPPSEAPHDRSFVVSGSLDDTEHRTARVAVLYRTGASGKFIEGSATLELGSFRFTVPSGAVKPPIVEYYVQAFDKGGLPIAGRGDADLPLRVVVQAEKEGSIFGTWWFWTGAAVLVGGGVTAAVLLSQKGGGSSGPTLGKFQIIISE
jgi:hypothetical protein